MDDSVPRISASPSDSSEGKAALQTADFAGLRASSSFAATGRGFKDYYPSTAAAGKSAPHTRLGSSRSKEILKNRMKGTAKQTASLASDAYDQQEGPEKVGTGIWSGAAPPGATGKRVVTHRADSHAPSSARSPAATAQRPRGSAYRKPGAVRFGGSGSRLAETTAPLQSRMAQGSTQEDQGAAGPLDLPEGEALSPAESTEEEEEWEVDGSGDELDEQLSGPRFAPGRTGRVRQTAVLDKGALASTMKRTGRAFAPGRTARVQIHADSYGTSRSEDPLADFRPGTTLGVGDDTGGVESDSMKATKARFGATQRSLKPANVNLGATGFYTAAQYPTQRMNASLRTTKKDFSLGVQPAPDDSGVGLGTLKREYRALPFNEQDLESGIESPDPAGPDSLLGYKLERKMRVNLIGWTLFLYYLGSFGFYLYVRIVNMNMGLYNIYSIAMLVVECLGASTVTLYGINLLWDPLYDKFEDDPRQPGTPKVKLPYAVRVLVVCYKEDLECVQLTIQAAAAAPVPYGCSKTIYLCDDGKDEEKRKWIQSLGHGFVYVSGRQRPKGETNGKSGNLNNVFSHIYPAETDIPGGEVLCIFDADQMACETFFLKTVPLLDGGDDVAMVLTPQAFHNLDLQTDIFNHSNIHFWEYMQPGADCIGFISCTGTNFLVRSNAFRKVGGSPQYTMTEDYALGMELKKEGFQCRYVREYLALGEAPHEVRNVFQQRSRWTKGHFQIFFQPAVCPLFQHQLSVGMRLMYSTGIWSYVVCGICTPFYLAVPVVTVWVGVFPLAITPRLTLAATLYITAIFGLLFRVRAYRHFQCLYFAGCCNQILWWAFVKAAYRALATRLCGGNIVFKATAKGKKKLKQSPVRDVWIHVVTFVLLTSTVACALWQMVDSGKAISPLLISVAWAIYGNIAPTLVLWYAFVGTGPAFFLLCRASYIVHTAMAVLGTVTLWLIHDYSVKQFNGGGIGLMFKYSGKTLPGT